MKFNRLLKIGEYEVDRHGMSDAQILLLALAVDPSKKQKEVLDAFGIEIFDFNGKRIYPHDKPKAPEPKGCAHEFELDGGPCTRCHKTWAELMEGK